eukprot:3811583-Heterocapsa_arctica.AAC.1
MSRRARIILRPSRRSRGDRLNARVDREAGPGNRRYGPACGDSCPDKCDARVLQDIVDNNN